MNAYAMFAIISLLILGISSVVRSVSMLWNNYLPDLSVYYNSVILLSQGNNPYLNQGLFTQVNYPPATLLLMYPLLYFSFPIASNIWTLFSVFAFLLSITCLYLIKPLKVKLLAFIVFGTVISFPFKFTLGMGQINLLLLFLISAFLLCMVRSKKFSAAVFFSLSVALKIFPIIFVLPIIFNKKFKFLLISLGLLFLLLIFSLILINPSISIYYFTNILLPLILSPAGEVYYNQSLTGFVARLHLPLYFLALVRAILVIISVIIAFKHGKNIFFSISIILTVVLLVNSFTWQHHLILLLLPFYFILSNKLTKKLFFLVIISYSLVAFNFKNPEIFVSTRYGNILLSHGFIGTLLLWYMLIFQKK